MNRPPLLLALDTSTSTAGVALYDGARVLSETTWLAGREHSSRLLIEVQAALERVSRRPADLTGLVVARGPGSFTGVRVAVSVAKGLAFGLGLPLWGVSSLDALAWAAQPADVPVRAAVEAGRGRVATALYEHGVQFEPPRLATFEDLLSLAAPPLVLIGELPADARAALEKPGVRVASPAASLRRAAYVAELGWRLAERGEPGDPRDVDALYVS
jgi:tRNA threonylcarbamoyladenosine biosynthesis protein TsaB